MKNLEILDCTLRDGGYINNWTFGKENINKIINNLTKANIDYIECGFLSNVEYSQEKSIFNNPNQILEYVQKSFPTNKLSLMINYGNFPIERFSNCDNKNILIRIAFKQEDSKNALLYCKQLKNKGYDIFINPMHTNFYSSEELLELIKTVNSISPYAFTIVDTTGAMEEKDVLTIFRTIDSNLDKNIKICFHSHNNLQLSFSNAQAIIKENPLRDLIIDSTVFGMGRGAGNIQTEQLVKYFNDNYSKEYKLLPILELIDESINPIYKKTPWGYSVPYYLAATNHCHPNYAKFLSDKKINVEKIDSILKEIPTEKKLAFDETYIKSCYKNLLITL